MQIERRTDESKLDYHKRLIYGKLVDKTLSDVDYSELAELAYGQSYSSDVARRMFYGSKRTLELLDESLRNNQSFADNDYAEKIDEKINELQKERQKFFDQRREFRKLLIAEGRQEHLYDMLSDAAHKLNYTVGALFDERNSDNDFLMSIERNNSEAVLVFSDWHYGMVTDNIFNSFNTDICKQRVRTVCENAKERILLHRCSALHIVVLGDLFHGAIHTSARVASEELVCDQLMQVSEILAQAIQELSGYVNETFVHMTYGNHARTVQDKRDNIHRDNLERIIPWWLKERLSLCDTIHIIKESDTEIMIIEVAGYRMCAAHGDLDAVKNSPVLFTALMNKKYSTDIEYILLGDKHHRESFEEIGVTAALCGSLCGTDDYANGKRLFSEPSQLMLIVTPEYGIDAEYRLKCKNSM